MLVEPSPEKVGTLRRRYAGHPASIRSLWSQSYVAEEIDFKAFRGDSAYVWQRFYGDDAYRRSYAWLQESEPLLLERCKEDGAFGARTVFIEERLVSRDLLDSVAELGFLVSELGDLSGLTALDIGAGYGRLAHRASEAVPELKYACVDAIPESTLICEEYLGYRGVPGVSVVPLDEVANFVAACLPDLAISVHSFPECPLSVIDWWLRVLAECDVRFLFLVPNSLTELISFEVTGVREDFGPLLRRYGFRREAARLKYRGREREHDAWLFQDAHLLYVRS